MNKKLGLAEKLAHLGQKIGDLGVDENVLGVCVEKHLLIDAAVEDQGGGRVPIRRNHAKVGACTLAASVEGDDVHRACRSEFRKIPLPGGTHLLVAAKLVQL